MYKWSSEMILLTIVIDKYTISDADSILFNSRYYKKQDENHLVNYMQYKI